MFIQRRNSKKKSRHRNNRHGVRLGEITGLMDINGDYIKTGDVLFWKVDGIKGIVLYNQYGELWFYYLYSAWYGDDPTNFNIYGKGHLMPLDNGGRMDYIKCDIGA